MNLKIEDVLKAIADASAQGAEPQERNKLAIRKVRETYTNLTEREASSAIQTACAMEPNLESLIRKAIADAWAAGADSLEANRLAIRKVRETYTNLTEREASSAVQIVRVTTR
jgi:FixJ family two-component response regulator